MVTPPQKIYVALKKNMNPNKNEMHIEVTHTLPFLCAS